MIYKLEKKSRFLPLQIVCYDFDKRKECPSKKTQGDFLTRGFSWLDSQI